MCIDPVSIAAIGSSIGTALGGAAAGASTLGGLATMMSLGATGITAVTQMQNAKAEAKAAEMNATAMNKSAIDNLNAGAEASDQKRRQGAALMSSQKAAMAANGVDVTSSSALDLLDDTKFMVEQDAFTIRENALRRSEGMSVQAANYTAEANTQRSNAIWKPIGTLLSGAAKVGDRYSSWVANPKGGATVPSYS